MYAKSEVDQTLAFVLASGKGTRLGPITANCAKPAVSIFENYRLIDFVLSNLVNSRVRWIYVLLQHQPDSLAKHIAEVWQLPLRRRGLSLETVVRHCGSPHSAWKGTAHAVYENLHFIQRHRPRHVLVFAADHVYRMDVGQMLDFHCERAADVTIAAVAMKLADASAFGVIEADSQGTIARFSEKPAQPTPLPDDPETAMVSMGNYIFGEAVLKKALDSAAMKRGRVDFGHHVIPELCQQQYRVVAYDFALNRVPGLRSHEEPGYWRDVGTPMALSSVRGDVSGQFPRFELVNSIWPLQPARVAGAVETKPRFVRPATLAVGPVDLV